jgi:fimbrial chaperone protein
MKKIILCFIAALSNSLPAQANLLVTPTRVELDNKRERSAVFSLVNKGTSTSRYDVYFEEKIMLDSGDFITLSKTQDATSILSAEQIAQMQANSIAKYLRYSPRRLTIEPEQGGRVRLALRAPKNMASGEYRSYIVFHQIPLAPNASVPSQNEDSKSLSLSIAAYMKIAIPVILRIGDLDAQVELTIIEKGDYQGMQSLEVTLFRQGKRSTYGDLEVSTVKEGTIIGSLKNAAVYPEMSQRKFTVPLTQEVPQGTELIIRFTESDTLFEPKKIESKITF